MAIPAIIWHELLFGVNRLPQGARQRRLRAYLLEVVAPNFPVISYDDHPAWIHATFRSGLETAGKVQGFADGLITATALANNLILVTRNTQDFVTVPDLYLENWFEWAEHGTDLPQPRQQKLVDRNTFFCGTDCDISVESPSDLDIRTMLRSTLLFQYSVVELLLK